MIIQTSTYSKSYLLVSNPVHEREREREREKERGEDKTLFENAIVF